MVRIELKVNEMNLPNGDTQYYIDVSILDHKMNSIQGRYTIMDLPEIFKDILKHIKNYVKR
jgi:hypothetical protein